MTGHEDKAATPELFYGGGGSGCHYVLLDPCGSRGGGSGGGGGTVSANSTGQTTSSSPRCSCSGVGLAETCKVITGSGESSSNGGNYLGSLLSNGDFWSGLIETVGGAFCEGGGMFLVASGVVECGTGILVQRALRPWPGEHPWSWPASH